MKCIVIETSPERTDAHPVTNEDNTPHIYATITEARAELKANGYSYNRANNRYYIKGTEYRAYIIREDSEEYAHTMEQAEQQAERAEIIAELVSDPAAREMYIAHAAAHQWTPAETRANIEHANKIKDANRAALALLDAYAEAIGEYPAEDDPETRAAYRVARDEITGTSARASEYDRETVELMTEAIARSARRPDLSKYEGMKYLQFDQPEPAPAPTYQRHELEAFLGEYVNDYDVDAIEAEATEHDPRTGRTVWTPEAVSDLLSICERHERHA